MACLRLTEPAPIQRPTFAGNQFDASGNLHEWWQQQTRKEFEKRAKCIIEQYGNETVRATITIGAHNEYLIRKYGVGATITTSTRNENLTRMAKGPTNTLVVQIGFTQIS